MIHSYITLHSWVHCLLTFSWSIMYGQPLCWTLTLFCVCKHWIRWVTWNTCLGSLDKTKRLSFSYVCLFLIRTTRYIFEFWLRYLLMFKCLKDKIQCVCSCGVQSYRTAELVAPCFYVERNALHQRAISLFSRVRSVLMPYLAHVLPVYYVQFTLCNHSLPSITYKKLAS